ncbi:PP2C family protein-serine/threonine phosphatase [Streptomyces bambusae]|uniref:SpoIIE family protein phosphatase n=1 Tax=Streptomyces bambusae TaxID=1550616 RepID=A0ABS6Z3B0_9ACTN|nr:PP2C family protein-serine/threonine phosphatase [Streptomyces bambusae]MBW5482219.1 SpoIIE family protein phosphatase [Streptomyces bambusae]
MPVEPANQSLAAAVAGLSAEVAELRGGRARRRLLDLATGVLVEQLRLSPTAAGDHLLELAVSTGLSAEDLAADVVNAAVGAVVAESPAEARQIRRRAAAVSVSDSAGEAAASLLEGGLRRLGVRALYLWRRTDTDCLELAGHAGATPQEATHWQWVPPDTPLHRVLWEGGSWWGVDDRLPGGGAGMQGRPLRAVMPLRRQGGVVGVALAVWPGGPAAEAVGASVRRTAELLCEPCGALLDAAGPRARPSEVDAALQELLHLLDQPAVLIGEDGGDPERIAYVNPQAGIVLGGGPDPVGRPAAAVLPYAWPALAAAADRVGAQFLGEVAGLEDVRVVPLGGGRAVVLWDTRPRDDAVLARVLGRLERVAPFREDLATGAVVWSDEAYVLFGMDRDRPPLPLARVGARLHAEDVPLLEELLASLVDRHRGGRVVVRVVRPDGGLRHVHVAAEPRMAGDVLTGIAGVYQDVSAQHRTALALSATADELSAAHTDALLRERLVRQLQEAISPSLGETYGLEVATRYRPAAEAYKVGGDWYDVMDLGGGRILLAVGDVAGHGVEAANSMVALRHALRGLALTGAAPGRVMSWLNTVTLASPDHPTATAVCAVYDRADHVLHLVSAGHLPPLLIHAGGARFLELPHNLLLGALPDAEYEEASIPLGPDDTLLLYTDGFVERRHVGLDESLEVLRRTAESLTSVDPEERAGALITAVTGDTEDDTSLVVVRLRDAESAGLTEHSEH